MPLMCSNYDAVTSTERLRLHYGVELPPGVNLRTDVWPTYEAPFVRRHPHADVGDDAVSAREAMVGLFGLVPHWARSDLRQALVQRQVRNRR